MSSAPSTPTETKKRTAVKAELEPPSDQSPASLTTKKTTKTRAAPKYSPTKADAWTPHSRLRLFEAYQSCANVKWDEVAQKMGGSKTASQCREQWQRATGKKIRKALGEDKE